MATSQFQFFAVNPFGLSRVNGKATFSYTASPRMVDIDGDGDLDVFVGDSLGGISFFRNTGTASLPTFAPVSSNPFGLVVNQFGPSLREEYANPIFADLDGDGDLDALVTTTEFKLDAISATTTIVTRLGENTLFFENIGNSNNPAFAAPVTQFLGANMGLLALVDIDGDGDLDAYTRSYQDAFTGGLISYLQNTGTAQAPSFAAPVVSPFAPEAANVVGIAVNSLSFSDLDGDGDLDALLGTASGSFKYYQNTGSATAPAFAASVAAPITPPSTSGYIISNLADIDDDGDVDLLLGDRIGNTYLYLNSPNPVPTVSITGPTLIRGGETPTITFTFSAAPVGFEESDITVTGGTLSGLHVTSDPKIYTAIFTPSAGVLADGSITVAPLRAYTDTIGTWGLGQAVHLDIRTLVHLPVFTEVVPQSEGQLPGLTPTGSAPAPTFADIDHDGDLDAFVGNADGHIQFYRNTGSPTAPAFASPATDPFGLNDIFRSNVASPSLIDIDHDGDLDIFSGDLFGYIHFFKNAGSASSPAFGSSVLNPFGMNPPAHGIGGVAGFQWAKVDFADIDGDGDFDFFLGNLDGNIRYFQNTGTASAPAFADPVINPFGLKDIGSHSVPVFADIDGDGDRDALISNGAGDILFFRNTGTTSSPAFDTPLTNPFGIPKFGISPSPTLADLNGDGDLDWVVGTSVGEPALTYIENTGNAASPAFKDPLSIFGLTNVGNYANPTFVDIDHDGDLDAFVGIESGDTVFFQNTGSADAPAFGPPSVNPFGLKDIGDWSAPAFADIDGDGDPDAFIGNSNGNMFFFQNTGSAALPGFADPVTNPFGLQDVGSRAQPIFVDIDGDGDLDAFIGINSGDTLYLQNIGGATAPTFAAPITNPFGLTNISSSGLLGKASPAFTDIDGDGDLDALIGNPNGFAYFFANTGSPTAPAFASPLAQVLGLTDIGTGWAGYNPAFADIDADGDADLFIGEMEGTINFFRQTAIGLNITSSVGTIPAGQTATLTFTFDAAPSGFTAGDVSATHGTISGFAVTTDPKVYTATFTPTADFNGFAQVKVAAGSYTDAAGNPGRAAAPLYAAVGTVAPQTVTIASDDDTLLAGDTATLTFTFQHAPGASFNWNGASGDLVVTGGKVGPVTATADPKIYTALFTPQASFEGTASVAIPVGSYTDPIGNPGAAGASPSLAIDTLPPTVTVASNATATLIPGQTATLTFTFSEAPGGSFTWNGNSGDLDISGGLVSNLAVTPDPKVYTATFTPLPNFQGNATVQVSAGGYADAAGNPGEVSNVISLAVDTLAPSLTFSADNTLLKAGQTATITFTFSEDPGNSFTWDGHSGDLVVTGGSLGPLGGTGLVRTALFTPAPDRVMDGGVSVAAGTYADAVGNPGDGASLALDIRTLNPLPVFSQVAGPDPYGITVVAPPPFGQHALPAIADLDGDGDPDLLAGQGDFGLAYFQNTGGATAPAFASPVNDPFGLSGAGFSVTPTFADLDQDGRLDVLVGNGSGDFLYFRNTGSAAAPAFAAPVTNPFGLANAGPGTTSALADLDGDGKPDLLVGSSGGDLRYYHNTGSAAAPAFAAPATNPFGLANSDPWSHPALVDIEGDGDLDVFVGNLAGHMRFFQNLGTATTPAFAAPITNPFGLAPTDFWLAPTFADLDGDGDPDFLVGGGSGSTQVFQNEPEVPCFLHGTRLLTRAGYTAVEDLRVGDEVQTLAHGWQTVVWLGHREVARNAAGTFDHAVQPIRIQRDAFGQDLPRRDLWISPGHAVYFRNHLIPAQALVNGDTVVREPDIDRIAYYHVLLDRHAVVFSEGLPTESYCPQENLHLFANADTCPEHWHAGFVAPIGRALECHPRVVEGAVVEGARAHLARRAATTKLDRAA